MKKATKVLYIVIFACSSFIAQVDPPLNLGDKFNSRGLYDNEFIVSSGKEIISDYDGNLMLEYSTILDLPGDLKDNFSVIYNANVEHRVFEGTLDDPPVNEGYSINAPEWIMGYKGIALQTLNFETNFYLPLAGHDNYNNSSFPIDWGSEVPLLIRGYHFTNKVSSWFEDGDPCHASNYDVITILRTDGSQIILKNIEKNKFHGFYVEEGTDKYGFALIRVPTNSNLSNTRTIEYYPGDGLTYIFEEEFMKYGNLSMTQQHDYGPKVLYLKEIRGVGGALNIYYAQFSENINNWGRKVLSHITYETFNTIERRILSLGYDPNLVNINVKNHIKDERLRFFTDRTNAADNMFSTDFYYNKPRRLNVFLIEDDKFRKDEIEYSLHNRKYLSDLTTVPDINFSCYLPEEIIYFTKKGTQFEYYNKYFDPSDNSFVCYDKFPQKNTINMTYSKRDCYTNFMLKKRRLYDDTELIKTEEYNYYSDESTWNQYSYELAKIPNIFTEKKIIEADSTNNIITTTKKFQLVNVGQLILSSFDIGSQIFLDKDSISHGNNSLITETQYENLNTASTNACGRSYFPSDTFYPTQRITKQQTSSGSISKSINISYTDSTISIPWDNSTVDLKKIKIYQSTIDSKGLKTEQWFSKLIDVGLSTCFYKIQLMDKEKISYGSLIQSNVKNEFDEAGRIIKKINNYNSGRETETNIAYSTIDATIDSVVNDKGVRTKYNYSEGDEIEVDGKIVTIEADEYNSTLLYTGNQYKPYLSKTIYTTAEEISTKVDNYNFYENNKLQFSVDPNGYYSDFYYDELGRIKQINLPGSFKKQYVPYSENVLISTTNYSIDEDNETYYDVANIENNYILKKIINDVPIYIQTESEYFSLYTEKPINLIGLTQSVLEKTALLFQIKLERISSSQDKSFKITGINSTNSTEGPSITILLPEADPDEYFNLAAHISSIVTYYKNNNKVLSGFNFSTIGDFEIVPVPPASVYKEFTILPAYTNCIFNYFETTPSGNYTLLDNNEYYLASQEYNYDDDENTVISKNYFVKNENDEAYIEEKRDFDGLGNLRKAYVKNAVDNYEIKIKKEINFQNLVSLEENGEEVTAEIGYNFLGAKIWSKLEDSITQHIDYYWDDGTVTNGSYSTDYWEYIKITDPSDKEILQYFDESGNKVAEKLGNLPPTIFQYNGINQLTRVIAPEQRLTEYEYDELGNISFRETEDDGIYRYKYDKWGNLRYQFHDGDSYVLFYTYDALNRLIATGKISASSNPFSTLILTPDDYETFESVESNLVVKNIYDNYTTTGAFSSLPPKDSTEIDAMNIKGRLVATAFRDVESSSNNWNLKYYEYDHLGNVKQLNERIYGEDWRFIKNEYDHIGNLVFQNIDDDHYIWNDYDVQGRLVKVKSHSSNDYSLARVEAEYSYNNADQIEKIGSDSYENILDNLTVNDTQSHQAPLVVANNVTVQSNGNLTLKGGSGITLNAGFSVLVGGELDALIDATVGQGSAFGLTSYEYDANGWVEEINNNSDGLFERFNETLTYEDNGNVNTQDIINKGNSGWDNLSFTYSYDNMNRLINTGASPSTYKEEFTYDDDGNFLTRKRNNLLANYTYESGKNRLDVFDDAFSNKKYNYNYDGRGNLILKENYVGGTDIYTATSYDHRNLPLTVNSTTNYKYDDSGNRIIKNTSTKNEYYLRDHTGREVAIYNLSTNAIEQVNLFGNGMVGYVEKGTTDKRYYYVKDHLGSVRMVIDEEGDISSARDYYAYGDILREYVIGNEEKYKFTEKERDSETGLDYFGARYFDSEVGRWTSVDPLADLYPGWSPYNYTANNPLNAIDPDGKAWNLLAGGIGALVGGAIAGGYEVYSQLSSGKSLSEVNFQKVGASTLGGATAGGLAGLTMGSSLIVASGGSVATTLVAGGTVGAVTNTIGGMVTRGADGDNTTTPLDPVQMQQDATAGLIGGAVGSGSGNLTKSAVKSTVKKNAKTIVKHGAGGNQTKAKAVVKKANVIVGTSTGVGTATGQAASDVVKREIIENKD